MKGKIALERRSIGYGAGAGIIQALALAGCTAAPEATPVANVNEVAAQAVPVAASTPVAGPERLVLAFGDSLYAGYGLKRGESLPDRVQERLRAVGINATVVNSGVSGNTTAAGRQRLAFALDNLPRKPDLVLLGLGGNDVLRQITPAETRANMVAMLDLLKARGIPVMLTGMQAPPNLGPDFTGPFNRIWPELAGQYRAGLYPFILDGVIGDRTLMQADYVHPNATGIVRIADRLSPLLADRLRGEGARPE